MVKSIYLQDGEEIFVDDEDYERVSQHTWYKNFNVNSRNIRNIQAITLSTFILKGSYQVVKNNDFTRSNLTTKGNRGRWRKANFKSKSKYKGVSWDEKCGKWHATITVDGKNKSLGRYLNEDDAAKAYNQAVLDYWNGNGYLNVIGEDNRIKKSNYRTHKNQNNRRNKEGYKGLVYINDRSGYQVQIKKVHIGYSKSKEIAGLMYNKCAIYLHGNDAILNDVPITDELKEFIANWEIPEKIKQLKE